MLFLHGVGGGAWSFEPQRAALAAEYACFCWEQRGHGAARPVADAGLADAWVDAQEALGAVVEASGPPVLIGHSMGGLLAMALACAQPGSVRGLFLIDPVYAETGASPTVLSGLSLAVTRAVMGVLARSYARDGWLSRALSRLVFRFAFSDAAARERAWARQRTQVPLEHRRMLFEAFEGVQGFPFRPFAAEVAVPTFLLEASSARPSRFVGLVERLRARLGSRFSFASVPGGHYLQLDRPAEVSARLLEFVRSLGAA